ncbi:MAG TPA: hypothetical protein VF100_10785, partial [Thermoanaerobaculia bacterium]
AVALACGAEPAAPSPASDAEEGTAAAAEPAAAPSPAEQGVADPEAAAVAARVLDAMGGADAWSEARFLRFGFAGRRQHAWDRWTGLHRVEGQTQEGESYVVIHDLDTREGRAWVDGEEVAGDRAAELLENAYGAWVNDTYWLLMPTKLRDPGVTLAHEGRREVDGSEYEVLHLSFAGVGLTPGDQYWAYVHPESGQMDYWAFRLESMPPDAEPVLWRWTGWQTYEGVRLASRREQVGEDRVLELSPIEVSREVPAGVFEAP